MAEKIEVVIKIPKYYLTHPQDYSCLAECVRRGVPLPKGHGRLGDLDVLETEMVNGIKAGNYEEGYETFAHINDMDDCVECVKYADTIIEADEAESEDKE
jgi:hypothetical protein